MVPTTTLLRKNKIVCVVIGIKFKLKLHCGSGRTTSGTVSS
jgi:hypothetical protein